MDVYIPEDLKAIPGLEGDLKFFFDLMVRKLHMNRHKGFVEGKELEFLYQRLLAEVEELRQAKEGQAQFDITLECVDISNFAFLLSMYCMHLIKPKFLEERKHNVYRPLTASEAAASSIGAPVDRDPYNTEAKRSRT